MRNAVLVSAVRTPVGKRGGVFKTIGRQDLVTPVIQEALRRANIEGKDVTMTWQAWANCMEGTGPYANADEQTKLSILAAIEENILKLYYFIPVCATTACSMLSYKLSYYTENYSIMYGFGGLRLINHNYSDAEWAEYVAEQGGQLAY
jgi:hypothetical protein